MAAIGDLVAIAGIETQQWVDATIRMQNSAKGAATNIEQSFAGMGAGAGRNIAQMGFAAQDFASVLEGGGKNALGRALMSTMNNVQMLGAMFGPWGMAITAVGGAIGAMLIPKLMEGEAAAKTFGESMKDAMKSLERLNSSDASFAKTMRGIDRVDKSSVMKERISEIDSDIKTSGIGRDRFAAGLREQLDIALKAGHLTLSPAAVDRETGFPGVVAAKGMLGDPTAEGAKAKEVYDESFRALKGLYEAERKLVDVRLSSSLKADELTAKERAEGFEKARGAALGRELDAVVERAERANKIVESSRTKTEVGVDRIKEIGDFANRGLLTPNQAMKAAKDAVLDSAIRRPDRDNNAAVGGTASGFAALQATIREGRDSPQVKLLQDALTELKKILAAISQNKPVPPAPVGIN